MRNITKLIAILLMAVMTLPIFAGCVTPPPETTEESSDFTYDVSADGTGCVLTAYSGDVTIKNITVPSEMRSLPVVEIGSGLFRQANQLEEVVLPESVRVIGSNAFSGLRKLTKIDTAKVEEFGVSAFENCEQLTEIDFTSATKISNNAFKNCKHLSEIALNNVQVISQSAFTNCIRLVKATLGDNVKEIQKEAFLGCSSLSEIDLSKVTHIGSKAFSNCASIQSVSLDSVQIIERYAFESCGALKTAYIGKDILVVLYNIFYLSIRLERVEFEPDGEREWVYVYLYPNQHANKQPISCWTGFGVLSDPVKNLQYFNPGKAEWGQDQNYYARYEYIRDMDPNMRAGNLTHLENYKCKNCTVCTDRHDLWPNNACDNPERVEVEQK